MKMEVICVAVTRVAVPGAHGENRMVYRCEFSDHNGGTYRVITDAPTFTPGNKHTITID